MSSPAEDAGDASPFKVVGRSASQRVVGEKASGLGMSPVTTLAFTLDKTRISEDTGGVKGSRSARQPSPPRLTAGRRTSSARGLGKPVARMTADENLPNRRTPSPGPDMSPGPRARIAALVSPPPTHNESDSDTGSSLSRSSTELLSPDGFLPLPEMLRGFSGLSVPPLAAVPTPPLGVSDDSNGAEDEVVASLTALPPGSLVAPRRFFSMSATNVVGRESPIESPPPARPASMPKKNLFSSTDDSVVVTSVQLDDTPFQFFRSQSMQNLSFAVPQSAPIAMPPQSLSARQPAPREVQARKLSASSTASVPVPIPVPQLRHVRPVARQRSGSMVVGTLRSSPRSSAEEKKRQREGMPTPQLPDPATARSSAAEIVQFISGDVRLSLPVVPNAKHDGINTVTCATVRDLLDGRIGRQFRNVFILDCRFDYEYLGGHIRTAIHANDPEVLVERFFKHRVLDGPTCFVFHCEFSSERGPSQLRLMRELDRKANLASYPNLFYPELYLMENGYSEFFVKFPTYCDPQAYISMFDDRFRDSLRGNLEIKKTLKKKRRPSTLGNTE